MKVLSLCLLVLLGCGREKETVVQKEAPPVEQKEPLTKCDEQHALADTKILACGIGDEGVRVMTCTALGWEEAYATCKTPPPRSTGGILGPVTEPEEKEETKPGPILPPPAPKPTTPAQID